MKFNKEKKCPRCRHVWSFDFTFCPHCGKRYRNIPYKKIKLHKVDC